MKVLVVDDDSLVAISLKTILEAGGRMQVPALGHSGSEAVELYESIRPDVLLMDIRMGEMSGLEAAEEILKRHPEAKILFLTTFSDDEYIVKALNMGAKGYILKQDFEGIAPAIDAVFGGQSVFGGEIVGKIPVLLQVAEGFCNREIAEQLFLSEGTVRNYISVILEKLALRDRTQLAVFYYKNKI